MNSIVHRFEEPRASTRGSKLWWDRKQFFSHEAADRVCPPVIDITGRYRHLVFGPNLPLEPGLWRATVNLELCAEAARRFLEVQFGAEPDYTLLHVPQVEGPQELEVVHRMKEGDRAQIRIWLRAAAFHGELRFRGVELARIGD